MSLVVAVAWTGAALFSEAATLRIGTIVLNVIRMAGSLLVLGVILWVVTGFPLPQYLNAEAWLWLSLSGLVGYVFGDYCLFNSYLTIGSRYGQLFMTLAPLAAALAGWLILGEKMSLMGILGMLVVGTGIGMSVLNKGGSGQHRPHLKLPVRGVLYGIGAAVGQGVGLVLSKLGMEHYQDGIAVH
ncbi:MAG: EamA family transporter, partial [Bacteroidaceae bacterium]|nr:EamA family transporter [Bacteroidaceae bacterium]